MKWKALFKVNVIEQLYDIKLLCELRLKIIKCMILQLHFVHISKYRLLTSNVYISCHVCLPYKDELRK